MAASRPLQILIALASLFAAMLVLMWLLEVLGKLAAGWPSPLSDIVALLTFLVNVALLTVLVFALPGALIMLSLGVESRWLYFLAGAFCGWLCLFTSYAEYRLSKSGAPPSGTDLALAYAAMLTEGLWSLGRDFFHTIRGSTLLATMAFSAALCGLGWRNAIAHWRLRPARDFSLIEIGAKPLRPD
jgi:hypothetical protein